MKSFFNFSKKWIVLLLVCTPLFAYGQTQTIRACVINKENRQPIPFATIQILNTSQGTTTDKNGYFTLKTSQVKNKIIINHLNYEQEIFPIHFFLAKKTVKIKLHHKKYALENILISANLQEQKMSKLTQSAYTIKHAEITNQIQSNLIDALYSTPGFAKVWEYHSPILLRGLNSNRVLILKDGNRRIGTFPGGYFGQDMNIYDTRRIEIIRGPGSVIYGNGAISGIVNVISESPFGATENRAKILSSYGSNNDEFLELIKVTHRSEHFGISANAKYRKTHDMKYGGGEKASNSAVKDCDLALHTGYQFNLHQKSLLNLSYHKGDWGKPRGFNGPTKDFTKINNKEESFHIDLAHHIYLQQELESIHASIYYDKGKRDYYQNRFQYVNSKVSDKLSSGDIVHYKNNYFGGRIYGVLRWSKQSKWIFGLDGYAFKMDSPKESINYFEHTHGKSPGYKDAGQNNLGCFIHNEWDITPKLRSVVGLRMDWAHVSEGKSLKGKNQEENRTAISGNLGLVYSLTHNHFLSINIGRAFRMPTSEELFALVTSCKGIKAGNPNLSPEYGWNFDLGCRGESLNKKIKYNLSLFYNNLTNFIGETASKDANIAYTYLNTNAWLTGGELSAHYELDHFLSNQNQLFLGIGAAYVYGVDKSKRQNNAPLFGIPPLKITSEIMYKGYFSRGILNQYKISLNTEFAAQQKRFAPSAEGSDPGPWGNQPSKSHLIWGIVSSVKSNTLIGNPKMSFIVNNLFDLNYKPFGSFIPAMGRNIKIALQLSF